LEAADHDVHGGVADEEHDVEEPLGPIDLAAWGAAIVGALAGLAAAAVFAVAVTR
jgi:hypothetical protein